MNLYQNFAQNVFYDGFRLLVATLFVLLVGGGNVSSSAVSVMWVFFMLALTIAAWLYAPFVFNPYQFSHKYFRADVESLRGFFFNAGGKTWAEWYEQTQLRAGGGLRVTVLDILYWFFFVAVWYTTVGAKMLMYNTLFPGTFWHVLPALPPVFLSLLAMAVASALEPHFGKVFGGDFRSAPSFHLAVVALACAMLTAIEAMGTTGFLLSIGWWRTCAAALILKYAYLSLLLVVVECLVGLGWCRLGYITARKTLALWAPNGF